MRLSITFFARRLLRARALTCLFAGVSMLSQGGCHRDESAPAETPAASSAQAPVAQAERSVVLAEGQLSAVKIDAAHLRTFAVDSETVGSISFDEDPSVVQAESNLLSASAADEMSQRELARVQGLGAANGIAPKEYEGALAAQQSAAASLKASRDAVRALGISESEIERMLRTHQFDSARTGTHGKWVVVNLPESESASVRRGQALRVEVPAYPGRWYAGTVSRIYATVDPGTHRVTMRALIEDARNELRAGMLATVLIRTGDPVQGVAIPATAVVREGDGSMIAWVTQDRRHFSVRSLKLGLQSEGHYQVLDGLKSDELVVTEGGVFLSNLLDAPPSD